MRSATPSGPDSREIHDQLLHVDRWLGQFLDSLTRVIENDRVVVVLTGDHGVTPTPEYNVTVRHRRGGRVWLGSVARGAGVALREPVVRDFGLDFDSGLLSADVAFLKASGIDVDSLAQALATEAARLPASPACTRPARSPERPAPTGARSYGDTCCPRTTAGCSAVTTEGYVWSGGQLGAEHSSANREDIEVPIVFFGPGIPARRVERPASTVDVARRWQVSSACPPLSPSTDGCCGR